MYNELIKMLRADLDCDYPEECKDCGAAGNCHSQLVGRAIEAIEELQNRMGVSMYRLVHLDIL